MENKIQKIFQKGKSYIVNAEYSFDDALDFTDIRNDYIKQNNESEEDYYDRILQLSKKIENQRNNDEICNSVTNCDNFYFTGVTIDNIYFECKEYSESYQEYIITREITIDSDISNEELQELESWCKSCSGCEIKEK